MGFITITQQKIENQTDSKNSNEKERRKSSVYSFTGILEIKANSWKNQKFVENQLYYLISPFTNNVRR